MTHRQAGGFTLVEIMIVVAIVGMLATMAIASIIKARQETRIAAFMNDLRLAVDAFEIYALEHGGFPADAAAGVVPAGMPPYMPKIAWAKRTPLGGNWDWDWEVAGLTNGVSVHGADMSRASLRLVDERVDDGDLATGAFREVAQDYYTQIVGK